MDNKLININFRTSNYEVREEAIGDKNYIVVPVVMMQEGVHAGSGGPLYHSIEELGKPNWDNIPVVINHPQLADGNFVSAFHESVRESERVGFIRNSHVDGVKLKAEAYLDVNKLTARDPDLLRRITGGEIINVSVGVFTNTVEYATTMNGNETINVQAAVNHVPDHLAILPHDQGACSVEDGCGIRVNKQDNTNDLKGGNMTKQEVLKELITYKKDDLSTNELNELLKAVKPLDLGLLSVGMCSECLQVNEAGVLERVRKLRSYLDSMDNSESTYYLEELNNDETIVYRVESRNSRRGTAYYKQKYTVNDAGVVAFEGEAMPVAKKVSYETVNALKRTKFNNNEKEVIEMSKVKELSATLIAHKGTSFVEDDSKWLETLSEEQLSKMIPKEVEEPVQVNNAVEQLSPEDKNALEFGKQQLKAHRDSLINKITANTAEGVWTPESLGAMDNDTLDRIAKSVVVKEEETQIAGVYVGSGTPQTNAVGELPLYPAGVEIEKE